MKVTPGFTAAKGHLHGPANRLRQTFAGIKRSKPKSFALIGVVIFGLFWLYSSLFSEDGPKLVPSAPYGSPTVVVVTALTPETDNFRLRTIQNREDYAKRHGYGLFITNSTDYDLQSSPSTWAKVPSMRHAMTMYPYSTYFFYLSPSVMVANMDISIDKHIMSPAKLKENMVVNVPVVPPDSVIKTFSRLTPDKVEFVVSQDKDGLGKDSFILRRGEWAKFFLDVWFDPVYRSYNFQKAEQHALEHIVQWHGSILAKLALVPQSLLNSYTDHDADNSSPDGVYKSGQFIANFGACHVSPRNCPQEMDKLLQ